MFPQGCHAFMLPETRVFLRRKFDGNVLKTWYDSAENAVTETRVNVMYPLTETHDSRHVSATVLCVCVKFPFTDS